MPELEANRLRAASIGVVVAFLLALLPAALAHGAPAPALGHDHPSGPAATGEAPFVPGELLVGYEPGVGAQLRRGTRARHGASLERRLELPRVELVTLARGEPVRRAARALAALPHVAYAEPNYYRELHRLPSDPRFGELWGLENTGQRVGNTNGIPGADISAPAAWEITTGSADVAVAVVDDGIDHTHADLAANVWRNPGETGGGREWNGLDDDGNGRVDDWRGWDFVGNDNDPAPVGSDADHGTHVAGTIGAVGDNGVGVTGVSWESGLMALRVFDDEGRTTISRLADAYDYAAANGARVLNGSYGGGGYSVTERRAIARAPETLFVVAAGNAKSDNDAKPDYPCSHTLANVVCVAATDNRDRLASFSNYGRQSVDLAAPGVRTLSTVRGGYRALSGTSMATPHVAGAAALLLAADPGASVAQLRSRLLTGVDLLPSLTEKVATEGRLNAERSLALGPAAGDDSAPTGDLGPGEEPADTTPPATRITKGPTRRTKLRRAAFRFRATEPATFRCRLDRRRWVSCSSPRRYRGLRPGRHVFRVRAIDASGNRERVAAKRVWRVRR